MKNGVEHSTVTELVLYKPDLFNILFFSLEIQGVLEKDMSLDGMNLHFS
jgi:hypothetical protein